MLMPWLTMYSTEPLSPAGKKLNIPSMQKPRWLTDE